jgi:hypothetical protein
VGSIAVYRRYEVYLEPTDQLDLFRRMCRPVARRLALIQLFHASGRTRSTGCIKRWGGSCPTPGSRGGPRSRCANS